MAGDSRVTTRVGCPGGRRVDGHGARRPGSRAHAAPLASAHDRILADAVGSDAPTPSVSAPFWPPGSDDPSPHELEGEVIVEHPHAVPTGRHQSPLETGGCRPRLHPMP